MGPQRSGGRVRGQQRTDSDFDILDTASYTSDLAAKTIRLMIAISSGENDAPVQMPARWLEDCIQQRAMLSPPTWLADQYGLGDIHGIEADAGLHAAGRVQSALAKDRYTYAYVQLLSLAKKTDWARTTVSAWTLAHPKIVSRLHPRSQSIGGAFLLTFSAGRHDDRLSLATIQHRAVQGLPGVYAAPPMPPKAEEQARLRIWPPIIAGTPPGWRQRHSQ